MPSILTPPIFVGDRFGDWTVVDSPKQIKSSTGLNRWAVSAKCSCGASREVDTRSLLRGQSKSCRKCAGSKRRSSSVSVGEKIRNMTVIKEVAKNANGKRCVLVRCDCGREFVLELKSLCNHTSSNCRSCCSKFKTHGLSSIPEYAIWLSMLKRCYDPFCEKYQTYGGSGVTVCDRWNPKKGGSFENFYEDVGPRPSKDYQLDKELVLLGNKVYSPDFAGWAHVSENQNRKSNSHFVELNGNIQTIATIAKVYDVKYSKLHYRIKYAEMSAEQALRDLGVTFI